MRVRMLTHIGGYRDEAEWPPIGGVIDVPDTEAEGLIAVGYAAPDDGTEVPDAHEADPAAVENDGAEEAPDADPEAEPDAPKRAGRARKS